MNDIIKNLDDFGEVIIGAKKHNFADLDLSNTETKKLPLSKLWAKSEIDAIENTTVAAIAYRIRSELPIKPRKASLQAKWFDKLEGAQTAVAWLVTQPENSKAFIEKLESGRWNDRISAFAIRMMTQIDRKHWDKMSFDIRQNSFIVRINDANYKYNAALTTDIANVVAEIKPTIDKALDKIKDKPEPSHSNSVAFAIYKNHSTNTIFIAARPDKEKSRLMIFDSVTEAREYLYAEDMEKRHQNLTHLNELWQQHKELNNIKKSDMRLSVNAERTGISHRNGQDITPEAFMQTFNIRGGQFGNWVKGDERQIHLNQAYDAFMDLSKAANIPPSAIGLGGELGIAFGARGSGYAAAHYETQQKVINLTKTKGAGSLAHEWWHALDHYLGVQELATRNYSSIQPEKMRYAELSEPLKEILQATRTTQLQQRSNKADNSRNKAYFGTNVEMTARAFESYISSKLTEQGIRNDYLVNITKFESWKRNPDAYVYPKDDEIQAFTRVYNHVFGKLAEVDKNFQRELATEKSIEQDITIEASAEATIETNAPAEQVEPVTEATQTADQVSEFGQSANELTLNNTEKVLLPQHPVEIPANDKGSKLGSNKSDEYLQKIADRVLEQVKNNKAPWQKPFDTGKVSNVLPISGGSGQLYKGLNRINLMAVASAEGYEDNRWFTYNNAQEAGGQVRRGEKGTQIHLWKFPTQEDIDKEKAVIEGREPKQLSPMMRIYTVFNAEQIDGLPERQLNEKLLTEFERHEKAESILENSGVRIEHIPEKTGYYSAYYTPSTDTITLPQRELFASKDAYYSTALHELAHATGHNSRLNRDLSGKFGSYSYAKEELRAEMASMMIGQELQIGHDPTNHYAYLQNWAAVIENDPKEFFKAAKDADLITNYVLALDKSKEKVAEFEVSEFNQPDFEQELQSINLPDGINYRYEKLSENVEIARLYVGEWQDNKIIGEQAFIDKNTKHIGYIANYGNETKIYSSLQTATDVVANQLAKDYAADIAEYKRKQATQRGNIAAENHRLFVPYEQKDVASSLGARWDKDNKNWYAPVGSDLDKLQPWLKEPAHEYIHPETEFARQLEAYGLHLESGHPIMDGRWHRLKVDGDRTGKSGAYIGHLDGVPRGTVKNFKTGQETNWTAKDAAVKSVPSSLDIERTKAAAEAKQKAIYNQTADAAKLILSCAQPAKTHPYLDKKSVAAHGLYVVPDKSVVNLDNTNLAIANNWREAKAMRENFKTAGIEKQVLTKGDLIVPAINEFGDLRTFQTISGNDGSFKSFVKGGEKSGSYHVIGDLTNTKDVIIAEGYATAATLHEQTGKPVVVAFDAGNLSPVAEKVRTALPDARIYIAADNDRYNAVNTGVKKATAAAEKVDAKVIVPQFDKLDGTDKMSDWNDLRKANPHDFVAQLATSEMGRQDFVDKLAKLPPEHQEVFKGWYDYINDKLANLPEARNTKQSSLEQEVLKAEKGLSSLPSVAEYQAVQAAKKQEQVIAQQQPIQQAMTTIQAPVHDTGQDFSR